MQEDERRLSACRPHVQLLCEQIQAFLLKGGSDLGKVATSTES